MQLHDPVRQVSFIQQALSQNRKPIAFFIGAGCPLSVRVEETVNGETMNRPLIQDVSGLTTTIADALKSKEEGKPSTWDKIVEVAEEDGTDTKNIELLLSKIRQLSGVAGKGLVRGLSADELDKLDDQICSVISDQVDRELPHRDTAYHNLAIWARSIRRAQPVHLFTTNYDLLLEQALEESSAPYFDGFVGTRRAFFDLGAVEDEDLLPPRWSRLWKIHGSLNWRLDANGAVVRSNEKTGARSYLIYPSHLKYDQSRKMPYLAMLDRLKSFLLKPSALLFVCGYSFADEHINDVICRSLETNSTAQAFAFMYGKLDEPKYEYGRRCAFSTPNLSMLGFDKAIIGRNHGEWRGDGADELELPQNVIVSDGATVSVRLGDFAALGNLLRGLAGEQEQSDEA
ncbi:MULTISPECIES: SIR2 family protein [unclassified Mesorhizobium]|uniref:SIR2 family NAD-dependent protein deacylase n=1 Tax=unclassified Mesorhizobium TaxID=325217 RepID=UPI000FCA6A77|nr:MULTISPECIES: SIR2 family protein [unclassified Mesorhizobium]RUZ71792.1 SIR2 family protein [Mesorhizobium sp. M7A.F.Ca.US.003.02.2.1]RUY95958.1 SIR2 family protein [Mesorhizobium sp. M7A.F.Ca.CA.001.12.2.1]RUZ29385.1 SIR2 family protein [Mesorhizobium sp. M7A.F.Ca.US.007.01.2.1]RUZ41722.1 SIR2 family protein [Mesorhizobium sp. M7A.F.Ca.US.003.02.1.1]RUZ69704.1 SIR2 family protein [Mesorhizobium sp. M7A.F.Ca.US.007.01.1.1]